MAGLVDGRPHSREEYVEGARAAMRAFPYDRHLRRLAVTVMERAR
jgi:hypothetical protein